MLSRVCVLLVLALAAFASAEEVAVGQELAVAEQQGVESVDMQTEVDAAADEEEVAAEDEEEAVAEDEEEGEAEAEESEEEADEFSLIEAEAEAETDEERKKGDGKKLRKPLIRANGKKRAKIVRSPRPIKEKLIKFHSERIVADTNKPSDPEMEKLDLALAAVKEDILSTNKQITDERKWVIAVAKIIASYNAKMKRVEAHIIALRKEMKSLYRKKKQIENLKLQRALEMKLKEARDELATLTGSLKHVALKKSELDKSGTDLRLTIAGIQAQLLKLRGIKPAKKAKKAKKAKAEKAAKKKAAPRPAAKGKGKGKGKKKCGKGKRFSRKLKKCVKKTNKAIARI